jgi:hypothetical protein
MQFSLLVSFFVGREGSTVGGESLLALISGILMCLCGLFFSWPHFGAPTFVSGLETAQFCGRG